MTVVDHPPSGLLDKAMLARAVLAQAERSVGVRELPPLHSPRPTRTVPPIHPAPPFPLVCPPARSASASTGGTPHPGPADSPHLLPVRDELAGLLPSGGLRRGAAVAVIGSTSLLLALVSAASQAGAWTAVIGFPAVGILAAADAGMDLDRVAFVPRPGPDAVTAMGALLDGVDIVLAGPDAAISDADRRRLVARARERDAVIVSAGAWPGAQVTLTARTGSWAGTDGGAGWLRRRTMLIERTGRASAARVEHLEVELPLGGEDLPYLTPLADVPGPRLTGQESKQPTLRLVG